MAEIEAICAKLQNKTIEHKMDKINQETISNGYSEHSDSSRDEQIIKRRKRKTSVPRNILKDTDRDNAIKIDRSSGALDLSITQPNVTDLCDGFQSNDSGIEGKTPLAFPHFLQNPLINLFMNNKEPIETLKYFSNVFHNEILKPKIPFAQLNPAVKGEFKKDPFPKDAEIKPDIQSNSTHFSSSENRDSSNIHGAECLEECIKRFSSYEDCKDDQCQQDMLRDHFHCQQCKKVILRREEMIRHSKWHKKREESLQFNFMRFSPNDDCNEYACSYNGRQTHYHCLHTGCNKIYISTSDVQMHSNFHKKDAAINQEGFQRYRATEFCGLTSCPYNNQRTTHFHCMRSNCKFTFKNKADMDKHKTHHQKNDGLSKEGFKKYIKYEHCDFNGCKFSKVMNHIHCIRPNCDYVVHSSAQINSHRRKHERRVLATGTFMNSTSLQSDCSTSILNLSKSAKSLSKEIDCSGSLMDQEKMDVGGAIKIDECDQNSEMLNAISNELRDWENSSEWINETKRFTANDPCIAHCTLLYKDHFHCMAPRCNVALKVKEKIKDHCRRHRIDKLLLHNCYSPCTDSSHINNHTIDTPVVHYHCKWNHCSYIRFAPDSKHEFNTDFNFLQEIYDHFDCHEPRFHYLVTRTNKVASRDANNKTPSDDDTTNDESVPLNPDSEKSDLLSVNNERKRGRPPKYKKNVQIPKMELNEEDLKDDDSVVELTVQHFLSSVNGIRCGFKLYQSNNVFCVDDMCMYFGRCEHYHCLRPRCHHATDSIAAVNLHRREFHHYMQIEDGYEYFDRSINCRRNQCQNNRVNNHYHCVRLNCDYSFKRFNTMHQHTKKHFDLERQRSTTHQPDELDQNLSMSSSTATNIPSLFHDKSKPPYSNTSNNSSNNSVYGKSFNPLFPLSNAPYNSAAPFRNTKDPSNSSPNFPPIIPGLNGNSSLPPNMNLNPFVNLSNSMSTFQNTIHALMSNNPSYYPLLHPSAKMPRLQLD